VIPTKNEGRMLGQLLFSIRQQTYKDLDITVVDAESTDRTQSVAKLFGCKMLIFNGKVSAARNLGARASTGNYILFLDSDVMFPDNDWLGRFMQWVDKGKVELAHCYARPLEQNLRSKVASLGRNLSIFYEPRTTGTTIFASRRVFEVVGGFNEKARL